MRRLIVICPALVVLYHALYGQTASDAMTKERMRELDDFSKWAQSQSSSTPMEHDPLLGGSDDDPTLAADTFLQEPPAAARKLAMKAEHFAKKQEHAKAIELFQSALQIDPQYYEAANNLALEYFAVGRADFAIENLRQLTKSDPKHVLAFDNLAILLYTLKRYSEAEAIAAQAYKMHPFSYKANYVYGAALVAQDKWTPDARQSLRYAAERHPEAKALLAKWPAQSGIVATTTTTK